MRLYTILITLLLLTLGFTVHPQSIKELQAQKAKLQEELKMTNNLLSETKKSASSSENKLSILRQTIASRKVLINNISLQIEALDKNMDTLQGEQQSLHLRLQKLKADYTKLLQEAQIRKSSYSQLLFIFSSESFSQAYRRFRYLQQSSNYRKSQGEEIQGVQRKISIKQHELKQTIQTKELNLNQQVQQKQLLLSEQQKENQSLLSLKKKNKELQAQLSRQQKQASNINARIEKAIFEEMRREEARRKAQLAKEAAARKAAETKKAAATERANKKNNRKKNSTIQPEVRQSAKTETVKEEPAPQTTSAYVDMMTKEEALVAGNFAANKKRLPWPVEKGFIRGHFGIQPHPILKHVTTNNKGIYIQAPRNSDARAVFEGVVTQRFSIPGNNNAIIIRHGNYRTVYANLTTIYVSVGDHVSAKQKIGRIFVDDENGGKTELYMMLWLDKTLLNPEAWLAR